MSTKSYATEDFLAFGRYKPDKDYSLSELKAKISPSNLCFFDQAFEMVIVKSGESSTYTLKSMVFALSPFFLLFFERPEIIQPDNLQLISARALVYLTSVTLKKYIDDSLSNTLILKWKNEEIQIICLNNEDVQRFMETLSKPAKLQVIQRLQKSKYMRPIKLKEVTSYAYKCIDKHELETSISLLEQSLANEKWDADNAEIVEKIKALIELYRKVGLFYVKIANFVNFY